MQLSIRNAVLQDAEQICDARMKAFQENIWTRMLYTEGPTPATRQYFLDDIESDLRDSGDRLVYMVATTPSDDGEGGELVVAAAKWEIYLHQQPREEWDVPSKRKDPPAGARPEVWHLISDTIHETRRKHVQGKACVALDRLVTLPEYQGKGAGSLLLKWGINFADEKRLPSCLEATEEGYGLYARYGFRDVAEIIIDFSQFGNDEKSRHVVMERPPATT